MGCVLTRSTEPLRVCVVCRESRSKSHLVRLLRVKTGKLLWAHPKAMGGKGVYVCLTGECGQRAIRDKKFKRLLLDSMDDECRHRFCQQFKLSEEFR